MSTIAKSTVGTSVYVLDTSVSPHVAVEVEQMKGVDKVGGGAVKKIDISNFGSAGYDEFIGGRASPPEGTGELVLDLTNTGQQNLKKLFEAGINGTAVGVMIYVGQTGSTSAPTVVAGELVPPQTGSPKKWARSGFIANCYLSDLTPKAVDNDVWRADFKFQFTGKTTWSVKGEAITVTY